jgi:hypothetical protein
LRGLPGLWSWGVFSSSRRTRVGLRVHVVKGSNRAARVGVRASDPPALPRANDAKRRQSRPNAVRTLLSFRAGPVGGFERRRPTRPSTCLTRAMRRSSRRRLSVSSANWSKRHQPSNACAPRGTTSPPRASGGSSTPPITHRTLPSICSTDYGKPDCPSATIGSRQPSPLAALVHSPGSGYLLRTSPDGVVCGLALLLRRYGAARCTALGRPSVVGAPFANVPAGRHGRPPEARETLLDRPA